MHYQLTDQKHLNYRLVIDNFAIELIELIENFKKKHFDFLIGKIEMKIILYYNYF